MIENDKKEVTDFFNMYRLTQTLPSKEKLGHKYDIMHQASFGYYALTKNTLLDVVKQCLWICKDEMECDAFSAMDLMENKRDMFLEHGFLPGDCQLHHYLVNWSLGKKTITPNEMGTITV